MKFSRKEKMIMNLLCERGPLTQPLIRKYLHNPKFNISAYLVKLYCKNQIHKMWKTPSPDKEGQEYLWITTEVPPNRLKGLSESNQQLLKEYYQILKEYADAKEENLI